MSASADSATAVSYIEGRLGLSFAGPRHARLMRALERTRAASGLTSYRALQASLDALDDVLADMVDALTVGETYFFRERPQLELLGQHLLPAVAAGIPGPIHVWSAGCSTGEEAFTLAIVAEECGLQDRCRVTGTDLSQHAIRQAREGTYGRWALRSVTDAEYRHFFPSGSRFILREGLRGRVRFLQHNLLDAAPAPGRFHVIFCRNVLIYLTPDAVHGVGIRLRDALTENGWLVTASGDPPLEVDGLERVRTAYGLAYRRADAASAGRTRVAFNSEGGPSPSGARGSPSGSYSQRAVPVVVQAHSDTPLITTGPAEPPQLADPGDRVRELGDAGRLFEAVAVADAAVDARPLDARLRYLAAVVKLESGELAAAAAAASAAVFLKPDLAMAHLLLGQIEHARGNSTRANRSFRTAARLLHGVGGDAPVELAEGVPAHHLAGVASRYLRHYGSGH